MKLETVNSYVKIRQPTNRDSNQMGVLASESYGPIDSTDQQTVINLNFSIDISNKKQVWVYIGGKKATEGTGNSFIWTNIVSNVSSQITLNQPLAAGVSIEAYKIGAYQETFPNPSSVTATLLNDVAQPNKMALAAFQPFVQKTFIAPPVTTILNRAQVEAGSLKAIAGIERVLVRSLVLSRSEFGSAGEPVWEADSKDSRIRFVGGSWIINANNNGSRAQASVAGDYAEFVFYGTGANVVLQHANTSSTTTCSIDGASPVSLGVASGQSNILGTRNTNTNQPVNVTSNLTLGWHTVRIINVAGLDIYGFEVVNQRTDLAVLAGTGFGGMKQEILSALSVSPFNAGVTGTRGARVVKYFLNGVVSQAVTNVNASSAFMTSADHTNEEVIRRIGPREFAANRADDYSAAGVVARSFTLDDGTTTMSNSVAVGYQANGSLDLQAATGARTHLTFVGTGLDFVRADNVAGATTATVYVNGVLVGSLNTAAIGTMVRTEKLCSGLPYGTHTVAIVANAGAATSAGLIDWLIYGPKKPALPAGAIEDGDFNVPANYVANTLIGGTASFGAIAQGVIRKSCSREFSYVNVGGSWSIGTVITALPTGWSAQSDATVGNYFEYIFYGTGFEYRDYVDSNSRTVILSVDGSSNFAATNASPSFGAGWSNVPTTSHYSSATDTFTASTGAISGGSTGGTFDSGTSISGLNLGIHKIRATRTAGTGATNFWALDIITPIHINTNLRVGSLSLRDSRAFSPVIDKPEKYDPNKLKASLVYDGVNQKILSSVGISQVLRAAAGDYTFYLEKAFKNVDWNCVAVGNNAQTNLNSSTDGANNKGRNLQRVLTSNSAGTAGDGVFNVLCFGELEDESEF